ncbi:hypothetical protein P8452_03522 [Trifolium repens]|nr:hypothetical protein P8452_03522 [Trifolium repens]
MDYLMSNTHEINRFECSSTSSSAAVPIVAPRALSQRRHMTKVMKHGHNFPEGYLVNGMDLEQISNCV